MSGDHFFDGFLRELSKERGKAKVAEIVARLNAGEPLTAEVAERELAEMEVLA
jgi:hypothetical protein